jgi:hypothetical protein
MYKESANNGVDLIAWLAPFETSKCHADRRVPLRMFIILRMLLLA